MSKNLSKLAESDNTYSRKLRESHAISSLCETGGCANDTPAVSTAQDQSLALLSPLPNLDEQQIHGASELGFSELEASASELDEAFRGQQSAARRQVMEALFIAGLRQIAVTREQILGGR